MKLITNGLATSNFPPINIEKLDYMYIGTWNTYPSIKFYINKSRECIWYFKEGDQAKREEDRAQCIENILSFCEAHDISQMIKFE